MTKPPNLGTVMLFWAAVSSTVGPNVPLAARARAPA